MLKTSLMASALAVLVLTSGCDYLGKMEAEAAKENAAQEKAVGALYLQLAGFKTGLAGVEPAPCDVDRLEKASLGKPPLTIDEPLLSYGFAAEVMDENEHMKTLGWWDFIRSSELKKLRPRAHQNQFIFDAAVAEQAMATQGVTAVFVHKNVKKPKANGDDNFESGKYSGLVALFENSSSDLLCSALFEATNSKSLFAVGGAAGAVSGGLSGALDDDFRKNILKSGKSAVSKLWKGSPKTTEPEPAEKQPALEKARKKRSKKKRKKRRRRRRR